MAVEKSANTEKNYNYLNGGSAGCSPPKTPTSSPTATSPP